MSFAVARWQLCQIQRMKENPLKSMESMRCGELRRLFSSSLRSFAWLELPTLHKGGQMLLRFGNRSGFEWRDSVLECGGPPPLFPFVTGTAKAAGGCRTPRPHGVSRFSFGTAASKAGPARL